MKIILTDDLQIGGYMKSKGRTIEVTKDYGRKLIREKKARDENFIEKLIEKKIIKKKKRNGNY